MRDNAIYLGLVLAQLIEFGAILLFVTSIFRSINRLGLAGGVGLVVKLSARSSSFFNFGVSLSRGVTIGRPLKELLLLAGSEYPCVVLRSHDRSLSVVRTFL